VIAVPGMENLADAFGAPAVAQAIENATGNVRSL
jgi:hypothetical protein